MQIDLLFAPNADNPLDGIEFVDRQSVITSRDGSVVFDAQIVAPAAWSQTAVDMLAQKYARKAGIPKLLNEVVDPNVPQWLRRHESGVLSTDPTNFGPETDARQIFRRLAGAWTYHGWIAGYFDSEQDAKNFYAEHVRMAAEQIAAANSPQWFNTGLWWAYGIEGDDMGQWRITADGQGVERSDKCYVSPGAGACYIQSLEDSLLDDGGLLDFTTREARVFKAGSGSGGNYSKIRGSKEPLSNGGTSSGLMSFLPMIDANAGAIKSGGTTRRAARMVVLDLNHPDIEEFIWWKAREEKKVAALIVGSRAIKEVTKKAHHAAFVGDKVKLAAARAEAATIGVPYETVKQAVEAGKQKLACPEIEEFNHAYEGTAYRTVTGQNANNSVSVTNEFMRLVESGGDWRLYNRTELRRAEREGRAPKPRKTLKARDLWNQVAYAAWQCADPGVQFRTTMNDWNTVANDGEITATNPCQPGFATVLTPNGVRTFDDIEVGSTIWSGVRWTRVIRKIATGIKPVSIYHTTAGRFVGTKDHKVIENGSRVSAEIADGIDRCVGPKHVDQLSIDPQDVVDGWVIGDGSRLKSTGRVYLNLGVKDGDFHRVLKDYVVKHQPGWNKIAWEVKTTITTDEVPPLPVRTIPDRFLTGSREKVVGFLRGLYSANGSVCGGRITLKATSFELVRGVQMMLSSIGIGSYYTTNAPSAVEWKNGTYTSKQSYDLNITGDKDVFTTQIGFVQEDKQARAVEAAGRGKRPWSKNTFEVLREEAIGEMPVYDIEVEAEEHTYWTDGLLVSNCSEFVFLDDSTCNLACLNLVKLVDPADWVASVAKIKHAARLWTVALDVTVGMSGYPSKKIAEGARKYRTFGLGYANLGGLLMRNGIAYDSDAGRGWAACITAIIHYETQIASASLADRLGAFPRCAANVDHVTRVMKNHAAYMTGAAYDGLGVEPTSDARAWIAKAPKYLREAAALSAQSMLTRLGVVGYAIRNAQTTLVMPAGTVGLLMDCDTTGVEPDFSLVKGKTLAGGGWIKIVNQSVTPALKTLGYSDGDVSAITDYVDKTGAVIGCTQLHQEHLSVFDCAVGQRSISVSGHLKMMAAVQPVLSGAISKTNNMAPEATVDDVREVYNSAHKLMLKCVALYRDGSKLSQPLEAYAEADKPVADSTPSSPEQPTKRKILPNKRKGYTQKVRVGSHKIYIRTGEYPDGKLGEIFLTCHREGAFLRSVMDAYAQAISIALQHNVPLEAFVDACVGTRFEPNGVVQGHDRIKIGTSILDVVMRDLGINYLGRQDLANVPTDGIDASPAPASSNSVVPYDGTPCTVCGALRVKPNGACKVCEQCGTSTGC